MSHWRSGRWLVLITILLTLCCIIQRSIGTHILSERLVSDMTKTHYLSSPSEIKESVQVSHSYSLSSCELSAKSLLSISSLTIMPFLYFLVVSLLISLTAIYISRQPRQKKHHHPPPPIRLHLHYCILRD